jgi:nucleoside-diphosphate-sugar epimerase
LEHSTIGIVGGSGFVGSSLAKHLSSNFRIKIFDKKPVFEGLGDGITFQQCDIRDYNDVKEKIRDVDLVIHTAIVQVPQINEQRKLGYEVNVLGTQNVCEAVNECESIKGLLLSGSWHILAESGLQGVGGKRINLTEERSKYYTLTKQCQELIVKLYREISEKTYGIIRLGTVLGEGMPEQTAANLFISRGLKEEAITPYKHSMYRLMFYVDIKDVCEGFERFARKILDDKVKNEKDNTTHEVNLAYPNPYTILDIANIVKDAIRTQSRGEINPKIEIVDKGLPSPYALEDKQYVNIDVTQAKNFLEINNMTSPEESLERIISGRLHLHLSHGDKQ